MAERQIVEAKDSFSANLSDGRPFVVNRGDRFWSDDPILSGRQHLFGELTVRTSAPVATQPAAAGPVEHVETATAAPGSRRVVTSPRSKPARTRSEEGATDA